MGTTIFPDGDLGDATASAYYEASNAARNWPKFNSAHEGFAILKEEVGRK